MKKILLVLIVFALVFSAAFGVNFEKVKSADLSNLRLSVKTDKKYYKLGEKVKFAFAIKNDSAQMVRLKFNTAKIFDFSIVSVNTGKLVYMYSKGQKFAQVITYLEIPARGEKTFTFVWNQKSNTGQEVTVGDYMVNFWLALSGFKKNIENQNVASAMFGISSTVSSAFPDVSTPAEQYFVNKLYREGLVKGYPDGTFKPNRTLTRAEATVLILRLLKISPSGTYERHFTDVPTDFWAFKWIEEAYKRGIVKGIGNGKFAPDREVTRGEFTVMLVRELKLPEKTGKIPFEDVSPSYFGYKEIVTAYLSGILNSPVLFENGNEKFFKPNKPITRGEAAVEMGLAYFVIQKTAFSIPEKLSEKPFSSSENEISITPSVPDYEINFKNAENANSVSFTQEELKFFEKNGFVIRKSDYDSFDKFYGNLKGKPVFVSFDTFLQAYHTIFDLTLRYDEVHYFVNYLDALNRGIIANSEEKLFVAPESVRPEILRDLEFMIVGEKLLKPDFDISASLPPDVKTKVSEKVNAEIALINAHSGFEKSPIFGYEEDYTQYVPRGHYTKTESLKNYFKAMMWFGRMRFVLKPGLSEKEIEIGRSQTRSALILSLIIASNPVLTELYDKIYEPTSFFVGKSDDLNFYDYVAIAKKVYGGSLSLDMLSDDVKLDEFIDIAMKENHSKISTVGEVSASKTTGFRFMGQRFTPDAYILQNVVYPKAGMRMMPKAMDVFFVLGNKTAGDIMLNTYGEKNNPAYVKSVEELSEEFSKFSIKEWLKNIYWGWLSLLKEYAIGKRGAGYPTFMKNENWAKKELVTALASYTELKHDTILYAKQSYTTKSAMPVQIPGYVEPNVEGFNRMLTLLTMTKNGLSERGLLPDVLRAKIDALYSITETALDISVKELENKPLTNEEKMFFATFPSVTETLFAFPKDFSAEIGGSDEKVPLVADIHTDPNSESVLEEGVGPVNTIFVFAPFGGKYYIFEGPVFSYYEFTEKISNRLTDEKWQSMIKNGNLPEMPVWEKELMP